jgi:transcription factor Ssl1
VSDYTQPIAYTGRRAILLHTHLTRPFPPHSINSLHCVACQTAFDSSPPPGAGLESNSGRYSCPRCHNHFCVDCDIFVHEVLHNCPGCWATGSNISTVQIHSKKQPALQNDVMPMDGVQVTS